MTNTSSHVAVIGAGNMGTGIALAYASHGHNITLIDRQQDSIAKSKSTVEDFLEQGKLRHKFSSDEADALKECFHFSTDVSKAYGAKLIIEAIFEDLPLKQSLFKELDANAKKTTILATNTSSLRVRDLQDGLKYPQRVLGLHYFFPAAKNRLVEIIKTPQTDAEVFEDAKRLQENINKVVVLSKDSPGFIVNRFFVPWLNESLRIVNEGSHSIATVENAAKTFFQIGMGPFALMNVTGPAIMLHASKALAATLGEYYAPCPSLFPVVEKRTLWDLAGSIDNSAISNIAMRLMAVISPIVFEMVHGEDICTADDVDVSAKIGLQWKKGPFELIKENFLEIKTTLAFMHEQNLMLPCLSSWEKFSK